MVENGSKKSSKVAKIFYCDFCDYNTCKNSDYEKHLATDKHKMVVNGSKKSLKVAEYKCDCGKIYKYDSGYYRHKKKCTVDTDNKSEKELIIMLLKQNSKLIEQNAELTKNGICNNSNNTNNSHNKTFNLNFFLHETCKDALNISDFVSSIKPTLEELEYTGRQGYVAGISNIIIKKLNSLEEYIRPIHCCDQKREILYIKDNDEWTKESEEKPILTKAIKMVANENIKNITEWKKVNPHCTDSDSQKNNLYLKIVSNSMCGIDKEETNKNMNKIISNVVKEVTIEKGQ